MLKTQQTASRAVFLGLKPQNPAQIHAKISRERKNPKEQHEFRKNPQGRAQKFKNHTLAAHHLPRTPISTFTLTTTPRIQTSKSCESRHFAITNTLTYLRKM
jgi:hypothetical protein